MEEVTINITEEVEEVTINVFEGGTEQIQSDFEQTDETAVDFIKNKPPLDDTVTETSPNAVKSNGIWTWVKGLFTPKDPTETEADTLTDESVFQFWKGELKKITWANIKAALRTYFDTIYSTFSGSYNDLSDKPTIPSNAAQITVSDQVTPDFTPAVQGNNLQQVTNKVAGLQNNLVHEVTFEEDITSFEITGLDLTDCEVIVTGIASSSINNGSLTVNDINTKTYWNSVTNLFYNAFLIYSGGFVDTSFAGRFSLRKVNNHLVYEHFFGNTNAISGYARTIVQTGYVPLTGNINSIQIKAAFWKAGTTLKIYRL